MSQIVCENSHRHRDGSKQNIGTFTYNEHGITVTKGTTGSTTGWSKDASGRWWYYDAQHGKPIFDSQQAQNLILWGFALAFFYDKV